MIVYKTINLINGKIYIGQDSKNDPKYLGSGKQLIRAIKKYGKDNFLKEILCECISLEELNKQEIFWIKYFNSNDRNIGYNITEGGTGGNTFSIQNEEKKEKIKQKRLTTILERYGKWPGHKQSEENKEKLRTIHLNNTYRKGSNHSKESKDKISKAGKNRKISEETKIKMGKAIKEAWKNIDKIKKEKISIARSGINNPFYGKTHSEETKKIMDKKKNKKKCIIDGIEYNSITEAMKILKIGTTKIYKLINK